MKTNHLLFLSVLFTFSLTACIKDQADDADDLSMQEIPSLRLIPPNSTQSIVDNSGTIHNDVLDELYTNAGTYDTHEEFAGYLSTMADNLMIIRHGFDRLPPTFTRSMSDDVVKLLSNDGYLLRKPQMDSIMNTAIDALIAYRIRNRNEKNLLNQAREIFRLEDNMADIPAFDSIIARSDRLLTAYNSYNWPEGEGNALGGFLNIAKSSAQYWKNRTVTAPPAKLPWWIRGWGVPQFDAAGYIIGWGKAWLWDELETPKKRIGAGLANAADWSGISALFK